MFSPNKSVKLKIECTHLLLSKLKQKINIAVLFLQQNFFLSQNTVSSGNLRFCGRLFGSIKPQLGKRRLDSYRSSPQFLHPVALGHHLKNLLVKAHTYEQTWTQSFFHTFLYLNTWTHTYTCKKVKAALWKVFINYNFFFFDRWSSTLVEVSKISKHISRSLSFFVCVFPFFI